ncbi:major capsid protein [Methylophilales phage MEP301]|nr:major capsid protein [Methylophilales phage MEP301]
MAIGLSNAFVTLFDAEVKQAYQAKAQLVGATRQRRGVEGATVKFPKVGKGVATLRVPQTDVTPLNVDFSQVTATLEDWNAAEYSDIFMQQKVNFDERQELVQVVANAIGRRQDQLILDALAASGTSNTVANDIGGTDTNLNVAKLREAKKLLDKNNVPPQDRHILLHANNLASLLSETAVTSSDFNTVKALVAGEINTFLGFTFHTLGDRAEGGLAVDGSLDRTLFAFHKESMGYAEGIGPKTEINYVPEKTSFLVNAMFSAASVAIDAEGIVQLTCRES